MRLKRIGHLSKILILPEKIARKPKGVLLRVYVKKAKKGAENAVCLVENLIVLWCVNGMNLWLVTNLISHPMFAIHVGKESYALKTSIFILQHTQMQQCVEDGQKVDREYVLQMNKGYL